MSTKIFNGRRLQGTIGEVYARLLSVKPEVKNIARKLSYTWLAQACVKRVDNGAFKGERPQSAWSDVFWELQDRQTKITREGRRDPEIDFNFEVWLFPGDGHTLCMLNTEQSQFREWFDALPFVEQYGYWNNTDKPEDVSLESWEQRKRDWDAALGKSGTPSEHCLTLNIIDARNLIPKAMAEVLAYVPSIEQRVERLVHDQLLDEHYQKLFKAARLEKPEGELPVIQILFKAMDLAKTDTTRRASLEAQIRLLLKPLTAADFLAPEMVALAALPADLLALGAPEEGSTESLYTDQDKIQKVSDNGKST